MNYHKDSPNDTKKAIAAGLGAPVDKTADAVSNLSTGWKECVTARSKEQRSNYCNRAFKNEVSIKTCNSSFCDTCCNQNIFASHTNVVHLCQKTCKRSTAAEESNEDYKNVCINSASPVQNVYSYCSEKNERLRYVFEKFL